MKSETGPAGRVLAWFAENRRDLPWRRTDDVYRIWISEVMLQQTGVDRVAPLFERFVERFPDVGALAAASIDEVLAAWSGLGYYRRARHLHAAARQIVARGGFPREFGEWLDLPGVGAYTAAAVTSIAFGERRPVLDGNVERVLSRFVGLETDPGRARGRRDLLEFAETFLDENRPGDSNQALMELGATICRPAKPDCPKCPLSAECVARRSASPERYPVRAAARKQILERSLAVVVEEGGRLLLFRRADDAEILAGLWELPWVSWRGRKDAERELAARYGGRFELDRRCGWIRHSITHRDIRLEVWRGRQIDAGAVGEGPECGWHTRGELDRIAVSTLVAKILERADAEGNPDADR